MSKSTRGTFPPPNPAAEYIIVGFSSLLFLLEAFSGAADDPLFRFGVCLFGLASVLAMRAFVRRSHRLLVRILFVVYVLPVLYLLYPVAIGISKSLHIGEYDEVLISIDKYIFGGIDPTRWIFAHIHLAPVVVELLEYSYFAHYLYALILGTELFLRKDEGEVLEYRTAMVYAAVMSFVLNMMIPAIGPRFTLHEFANIQTELPGLWGVDWIRSQINTGEGITQQMTSSVATLKVFRDAFPSGHTMLTVVTLIYAFRTKAIVRWILLPLGISLICSTVLLRYHYVIDVIGGIAFALIAVLSLPAVMRFSARLESRRQR
ncbi:MAG: phosphatase PAP2 family protein [Bacteroidota bacterium]|nr:phosphatase PAP2 family protein [Bacteroidota bacterium]MDP4230618.1 phosphatase PAP2 family protein [Bacteroidota bacterium]MDP4235482.1 phosphatase PAP2 family protein [Bacteroidota bacterium]